VITGFGIGWASMMDSLFMVIHNIRKERYGVYMGIINMMIVIYVYSNHHVWIRTQKLLNNDPRLAISFAGVLLLISAGCTLLIKTKEEASE
jgi:maltose/moltooligosaccharide transporter